MEDIYKQISVFFSNLFVNPIQGDLTQLNVDEDIATTIEIVIADRNVSKTKICKEIICMFTPAFPILADNSGKNSMSAKINDKEFIKVQLSDQTDPLINEVIINKIINSDGSNNLFSRYLRHCIHEGKQALITEYMNITSIGVMFDRMPEPSDDQHVKNIYSAFLCQLNKFVGAYIDFSKTIGFTHNDMHFGNLVISNSEIKVIDYGRSCIDKSSTSIQSSFDKIVQDSCAIYGYNSDIVKDMFPSGDKPSSSKRLAFFQVLDFEYGYMTDIASVCLSVLPLCGSLFTWPECLKFDISSEQFTVDLSKGQNATNIHKYANLYKGVYFLAAYIAASSSSPSPTTSPVTVHIDKLLQTLFWSNGMCKNTEYHKVKTIVHKNYNTIINDGGSTSSSGGRVKAKLPLHLRHTGGTNSLPTLSRKDRIAAFQVSTNSLITELVKQSFQTIKTDLKTQFTRIPEKVAVQLLPSSNIAVAVAVASGGGNKKRKIYAVKIEKYTNKKYIILHKSKWYFSENKGKYVYVDEQHGYVQLKGSKINILKQ